MFPWPHSIAAGQNRARPGSVTPRDHAVPGHCRGRSRRHLAGHKASTVSPPAGHVTVGAHCGKSREDPLRASSAPGAGGCQPPSHPSSPGTQLLQPRAHALSPGGRPWGGLRALAAPFDFGALRPCNTDKSFPRPDVRRAGAPGTMGVPSIPAPSPALVHPGPEGRLGQGRGVGGRLTAPATPGGAGGG